MSFYIGLDLGQSNDYTALAVVEKATTSEASGGGGGGAEGDPDLHLRHLERYPLRTPYPEMVAQVAALVEDPQLRTTRQDHRLGIRVLEEPDLLVDATGVGRPVVDLFKERGLKYKAITITGGNKVTVASLGGGYGVPKRDLIGALEVPFHSGRLKVAAGLALWETLRSELQTFRRKVSLTTGMDTYEHWRESDHDDLVLAAALACWGAERKPQGAAVYSF
jgi:hypothetical protein